MSLDVIELALDRMTDFIAFERLATEVMYLAGWYDIRPLGGTADLGQDAVAERFFGQPDTERTVFQYTLQHYLPGKVTDTANKLRANKIGFSELVVVTPHPISSETQIKMKRAARADHGVHLDIFDRQTILTRLADLENGIFHRNFPNIKAQIDDLTRAANRAGIPQTALERTLLQVSLALTFRPGAFRARKSLFDHFVLAVILDQENQSAHLDMLADLCAQGIHSKNMFPYEQIEASVVRLAKMGLVSRVDGLGLVRASEEAMSEVATSTVRLSEATSSFAADILAEVTEAQGKRLPEEVRRRVVRNIRAALAEIARARGAVLDGTEPQDSAVPVLVRRQLDDNLANLVVAALAEALRTPTPSQAETITRWTQAYIGFALMGLDPVLNYFQVSKFSDKIFFLDTDIVLAAIIANGSRSAGTLDLLASLAKRKCRLIVPESVVDECVQHAALSERTYQYFGAGLLQLIPEVVEERVWNAFAVGYYYARTTMRIPSSVSYRQYLANYYERKNPRQFLGEVIKDALPDGVEILSANFNPDRALDDEEVGRFAEALQQDLARSKKAQYRTDEQERELARTDATLYLSALQMNPSDESRRGGVLGGICYLLTETSRYERVAKSIGIATRITVRPGMLAGILGLIGESAMNSAEFVQLFDNPLLDQAVSAAWPDMDKLMRSGVDLQGKTLTRLRFDLDHALHKELTELDNAQNAEGSGQHLGVSSDERFLQLITSATARGYSLIPEVEAILHRIGGGQQRVEKLERLLDEAMSANKELEKSITFFGRRRQKYLRRIGHQLSGKGKSISRKVRGKPPFDK